MVIESVERELVLKESPELQLLKKYERKQVIVAMLTIIFFMTGYFVIV
jgi:hypothetical protein